MRKYRFLPVISFFLVILAVMMSCTKEGPQGPQGPAGKNGEDGINGKDGNATCGVCHDNSEGVNTKIAQWGNSIHAIGGHNFENRTSCAPCHTSQGFKEVILTDSTATKEMVHDPNNINCYTCHKVHDTYTEADWELRKTTPITFWLTKETFDLGVGNLCAQCHQPRISYAIPDVTDPDGTYKVTSSRFGPHHGSQGAILTGSAMYNVGEGLFNSSHAEIANACVTCHMADAIGYHAGGHTWRMFDEYEGEYNVAGCLDCHEDDEALTLIEDLHDEIEPLLQELGDLLITEGIYNPDGTSGTAVAGTYSNRVAGAYWNFISIEEDRSLGVHNPRFVEKILENTIESLKEK